MDILDGCDIEERELPVLRTKVQSMTHRFLASVLTGGAAPLAAADSGGADSAIVIFGRLFKGEAANASCKLRSKATRFQVKVKLVHSFALSIVP